MTDACKEHYQQLHAGSAAILAESFTGSRATEMAESHSFISDLSLWVKEIVARPEAPVLQSALREYQFALLALSAGHYRAAFGALRLSLELTFATVQWSTNERELREWRRGQRDSNWKALSDPDNGVLSKPFVLLFTEGLAEEATYYRASAVAVYRECSEYVHGNAHSRCALPESLAFDEASFTSWHQKASASRLAISFVLAARYLQDLDSAAIARLESVLSDQLGHSPAIRAFLGAPSEAVHD